MTEQILVRPLGDRHVFGLVIPSQGDSPLDGADGWVSGVDAAVNHGHGDPGPGGAVPGPGLVDGQVDARDLAQRVLGKGVAPGGSQGRRDGRLSV
jgi:hypothetical protein